MYDILEVAFVHPVGSDRNGNVQALEKALAGEFEVEALDIIEADIMKDAKQLVRIIAIGEAYGSGDAFEQAVLDVLRRAPSAVTFQWNRIGVVPVGETESIIA